MSNRGLPGVKIGCYSFPISRKDYFRQFTLVEVQQTFYKIPRLKTAQRWRQQAPSGFEFTLKAWQLITHSPASPTYRRAGLKVSLDDERRYGFFRPTDELHQAWEETRRFAQALESKIILFQSPPSFKESPENSANLKNFFRSVNHTGFLFVWEPRGGWNELTVKNLCSDLGLIHCVDPLESKSFYGEIQYFRLHGGSRYQRRYTKEELEHLKSMLGEKKTYLLFNNLNMLDDALAFNCLLKDGEDES